MITDTPPLPTPAMKETSSAIVRKAQLSLVIKFIIGILVSLQAASVPTIGYLVGRWDALEEIVGKLLQRTAVLESRQDQSDKISERIDQKLDRLLEAHRQ